jgi:hypothetical protein
MSEPIRITVPFDPHRLSLNARLHWRARKRLNDAAKEAAVYGWMLAGQPKAEGPVRVSLIVRRGRRLDIDNAITGTKACRDALFKGRVTPDDSPRWVTLGECQQECGKVWRGREECVFVIERAG